MQFPGYTTGSVALQEGEWLPFKIHNLIQLQDDNLYFVLQDINGMKHFLTAEYYMNYNLKVGDEISCKIDRINCTGRIFLEPKHPYYTENEIYTFDLLNYTEQGDEISLLVKGFRTENTEVRVFVPPKMDFSTLKSVKCIVKSLKKGKLILELYPFIV